MSLTSAIPALPVRDVATAVAFYCSRLGFAQLHVELHLWQADDASWSERSDLAQRPVRSGAESFLAGTASCRLQVGSPEELAERFRRCADGEVLHPVSQHGPEDTTFGVRQFHVLDRDGNLVTFFVRLPEA